jgi:hypothetical protein
LCNKSTSGNLLIDEVVKNVDKIPTLSTPEKEGYKFNGWVYENGTPASKDDVLTKTTYNYAEWVELSYDEWLGVSYDEEATEAYFNNITIPVYNYTEYEKANSITPTLEVGVDNKVKIRIYFNGNIPTGRIDRITYLNKDNEQERVSKYSIWPDHIEFYADYSILDYTFVLTNGQTKHYSLPRPNYQNITCAFENFILEEPRMINKNQEYTIKV